MNIEEQYLGLMSGIIHSGKDKEDRTGTGTRSVFGRMLQHDMKNGFPLLTTKKIYWNNAVTELLWILQGRTDIGYLNDNGVKYWNPDYKRSGRTDGTLGPVYGHQWRNFNGVDQLVDILKEVKRNPSSRRLMVNAWNPADLPDMALPPCHYGFQLYVNDGQLDLMWNQRSADVFLGLPYDIAMYGLLLELIAEGLNLTAGRLTASLGDCHLYLPHIDAAKEQLSRDIKSLPSLKLIWGLSVREGAGNFLHIPTKKDIILENYDPAPPIKAELFVG